MRTLSRELSYRSIYNAWHFLGAGQVLGSKRSGTWDLPNNRTNWPSVGDLYLRFQATSMAPAARFERDGYLRERSLSAMTDACMTVEYCTSASQLLSRAGPGAPRRYPGYLRSMCYR